MLIAAQSPVAALRFIATPTRWLVTILALLALLGLRVLYFVRQGALSKLVQLGNGLAAILAFISVKLVLLWADGAWVDEFRDGAGASRVTS